MSGRWWICALAAMVIWGARARARARALAAVHTAVETLEWMAADADAVVVARYVKSQEADDPARVGRWAQWEVDDVIKGPVGPGALRTWMEPRAGSIEIQGQSGRRVLLFLTRASRQWYGRAISGDMFAVQDRGRMVAIDRPVAVLRVDGSLVHGGPAVLEAVKRELARNEPLAPALWLNAPPESALVKSLGGRDLHLTVPANGAWREEVRRRVLAGLAVTWDVPPTYLDTRIQLKPTAENVELIRWMMKSGAFSVAASPAWPKRLDWHQSRHYFHRRQADRTLRGWGMREEAVLQEPLLVHRPVRAWVWGAPVLVVVVVAGWIVARRRRVWGTLVWASFMVAIALAGLWWRSWTSYQDVMWAGGKGEYEVSSHRGVVRWLWIDQRADPRPLGWASSGGDGRLVPRHHEALSEAASASRARLGWSVERGLTPSGRGIWIHPFVKVGVSHGWFVGAAMLLPGVWLVGRMRGMVRRRSRRRAGRCVACGYNLRGLDRGKCPECGNDQ